MTGTVQNELGILNRDIARYQEVSGKLPEDVLLKQGGKLVQNLSNRLKRFTPEKGFVTQDRLAALKEGEGVRVRPAAYQAVYAKYGARTGVQSRLTTFAKGNQSNRAGLNLQALAVKRELAIRESGRGFISFAARAGARFGTLPGLKAGAKQRLLSRYGSYLATVGFEAGTGKAALTFTWTGSDHASEVADVLKEPRAQAELAVAIQETSKDIREYLDRKTAEDARKAFR